METFRGVVVVAMIGEDVKKAIDNHARKIDHDQSDRVANSNLKFKHMHLITKTMKTDRYSIGLIFSATTSIS